MVKSGIGIQMAKMMRRQFGKNYFYCLLVDI